jgi:hypothetical protein
MSKMTALIVNLFEILGSLLKSGSNARPSFPSNRSESSRRHSRHLVRPSTFHQQLSDSFIDQFDEVLVIGDVHGCFDELLELLQLAEQRPLHHKSNGAILKVFVGDLINKGPKSKQMIDFMRGRSDDCLSVRGNHEEISIKAYFSHQAKKTKDTDVIADVVEPLPVKVKKHSRAEQEAVQLDDIQMDKYDWARELNREQIDYLISLPYTISIPSLNAIVGKNCQM